MMKRLLCILLALLPLFACAKSKKKDNSNPKYLVGAVTLTDGKVTFSKEFNTPSLTKDELYKLMLGWANNRFHPEGNLQSRVLYSHEDKGEIVASGEEYLVFSSTALSLDRTRIYYQLLINTSDGLCKVTMSRIRYWYDENRDGGEKYTAEEWITDDIALNKKKTKLAPLCGKFRRETIDMKDALFKSVADTLGYQVSGSQARPNVIPATPLIPATPVATGELKEIPFSQLPANLSEMASKGRITIAANDEEIDIKPENWGGFGKLFNKDVAYVLVDQSRLAINALMENSKTYKVSFYAAGSSQPTVVIECKKSTTQKMSTDELKSLNPSIDTSKTYLMYIGEVTHTSLRQ